MTDHDPVPPPASPAEPRTADGSMTIREVVDGVIDLFPGADRQALQCLAELLTKPATPPAPAATDKEVAEAVGQLRAYAVSRYGDLPCEAIADLLARVARERDAAWVGEEGWRAAIRQSCEEAVAAEQRAEAAEKRFDWMVDWFMRDGRHAEIVPDGHIRVYTRDDVIAGIDAHLSKHAGEPGHE